VLWWFKENFLGDVFLLLSPEAAEKFGYVGN